MTGTGSSVLGQDLRLSERGKRSDLPLLDRARMFFRHTWISLQLLRWRSLPHGISSRNGDDTGGFSER